MSLVEILILACIQGLTEFLPVSSSGHLVVANGLLEGLGRTPIGDLVEVSVALHLGTLLAILTYYRLEIVQLFGSDRHVISRLVIGTLPAIVVGLLIRSVYPQVLGNPLLTGFMFLATAGLLILATWCREGKAIYRELSLWAAFYIGLFQAFALLPGISRSGATIAGGIFAGQKREHATTFAFLLAIPVIASAGALESITAYRLGTAGTPVAVLVAGMSTSFAVGYVALGLLARFIARGHLAVFAWYLIPLGILVTIWQLARISS